MERSEIEQLVTMYEIEPFGRDLWVQKKVVKTEDIEKINRKFCAIYTKMMKKRKQG